MLTKKKRQKKIEVKQNEDGADEDACVCVWKAIWLKIGKLTELKRDFLCFHNLTVSNYDLITMAIERWPSRHIPAVKELMV